MRLYWNRCEWPTWLLSVNQRLGWLELRSPSRMVVWKWNNYCSILHSVIIFITYRIQIRHISEFASSLYKLGLYQMITKIVLGVHEIFRKSEGSHFIIVQKPFSSPAIGRWFFNVINTSFFMNRLVFWVWIFYNFRILKVLLGFFITYLKDTTLNLDYTNCKASPKNQIFSISNFVLNFYLLK